ncbi:TonB-dependent receptor [Sphingobacterium sp. SGR-19]|uniref:TonB-dependent receptor n=1 Tax=Sphingobacterium sp. SGR-19 TaxID=2710886 RepID=UPI0013ECC5F9|nr:TonB-dependent receptor [Sphingobacterium sp. SGR-19]NGM64400.1 TonB-dependent receptor [Sphingobacterium sp. SGR-19]
MLDQRCFIRYAFLFLALCIAATLANAQQQSIKLRGTVYEMQQNNRRPLGAASVKLSPYGLQTHTNEQGEFQLEDVPVGAVRITVSHVGMADLDTNMVLTRGHELRLILRPNSYRLREVDVTGRSSSANGSSSTHIGRNAIDHLQANSLSDVMSLVPGGLVVNPNLNEPKQINIRNVANATSNANAFGTSIVLNGSPVSNNANLQTLTPVHTGSSMSGGTPPTGGFDTRNIPLYNIESVEVIRGIPSVKYGDMTSGAVIVNQKAGVHPLTVEGSTNPNLYGINLSKGFALNDRQDALSMGADYAHNTHDPVQSYLFYERTSLNALYSSNWLKNKLRTHHGLVVFHGGETRRQNPNDETRQLRSSAKELGWVLNSSGTYRPQSSSWWRELSYSGRIGVTDKEGYYQQRYTAANAAYGMSTQDGAILSNTPGGRLFDEEGREITRILPGDEHRYAIYLPSTYLGMHQIDGKEFNAFFSANTTFFHRLGNSYHTWLAGGDFKIDRNFGTGRIFADSLPPYRNLSYVNSSFRNWPFDNIPALYQIGAFVEDNIVYHIGDHRLNVIAGLRYDRFSGVDDRVSPRINFSADIVPDRAVLRLGYGSLAKAPGLLYTHPEPAYFDYININEMASGREDALFMTTTRVFDTKNNDLKIATNTKLEAGVDLRLGKTQLHVTLFQEKLRNAYGIGPTLNTFRPVEYLQYERAQAVDPTLKIASSHPVLASFNQPHSNNQLDKWGLEFDLNLGRVDAIRTAFQLYGAHIQQKSYSSDYFFYDEQSGAGAADRTHIGLYAPEMTSANERSTVTTLKIVHNIPRIGFVVTLTTDAIWNESNWTVYGNDSIPLKYISKIDGQVYEFNFKNREDVTEKEFQEILRPVARPLEVVESFPAMFNFNMNISKEIKDFLKISFFANNLFRSYPVAQSDRVGTRYYTRNMPDNTRNSPGLPFFFGFRVGAKF